MILYYQKWSRVVEKKKKLHVYLVDEKGKDELFLLTIRLIPIRFIKYEQNFYCFIGVVKFFLLKGINNDYYFKLGYYNIKVP